MRKVFSQVGLIIGLIFLWACGARAQVAAVSGNLRDLGANNATSKNSFVQFTLVNFGSNIPRVIGTNAIVSAQSPKFVPDGSGNISGNIQKNNSITPTSTFYRVCIFYQGTQFQCNNFLINADFNLNSATPITTTPVVPAPTGDSTYLRLDAGNSPVTGLAGFSAGVTSTKVNGILYVGTATGQYATLQAAHDALPSTGGTVFVMGNATPFGAGTTTFSITKPLHVIVDDGTFPYTGTGQAVLCTSVNTLIFEGSGFQGGGSADGTIISVTNTAANGFDINTCPGAQILNLNIVGPGSGTGKGLIYTGNSGLVENVVEKSFGGNGCEENGTRGNSNGVRWNGVRCVSNGGIGLNVFGANANLNKFTEVEVSLNTGLGAQIATATNIFDPLHSFSNNSGGVGVSFISGASQNRGTLYSDLGTQTTDLAEAAGANNNKIGFLSGQNYTDAGTNNSSELPRYLAPGASCGTPSYSFQGDNTTGFYDVGGGALGFCSAATESFLFSLNLLRMGANGTYGFSSNAAPSAAGNDAGISRAAAGLVAMGTGAQGSRAGKVTAAFFSADGGAACTNGELALSAGWQLTGAATVTAAAGASQTCMWTITTGTTTGANPTVTDTLVTPTPVIIVCEMNIHGGTHTAAAGEGFLQTGFSTTAPVFTFQGTPTAGGTTYFVTRRCGP